MNKEEICREVTERTGIPLIEVRRVVSESFDIMRDALSQGVDVRINNFGAFRDARLPAGDWLSPRGQKMKLPERYKIRFTVSKNLEIYINKHLSSSTR